jgi:hypothetical protein
LHEPPHVPLPLQVRAPCGAPAGTTLQTPGVTSHASHVPPHALSQQKPSTQKPDVHCVDAVHIAPFGFVPRHAPLLQNRPPWQSASVVQLVLHAVGPQVNGAHAFVDGAGHAPAPSQAASAVCVPFAQLASRHFVVG